MINVNFKLAMTQTASPRLSLGTRPAVRMSSIAMSSRSFRYMEMLPASSNSADGWRARAACVLSPQSC